MKDSFNHKVGGRYIIPLFFTLNNKTNISKYVICINEGVLLTDSGCLQLDVSSWESGRR